MNWIQFILLLVVLAGLFQWNRSESNADRREANADRKSDRKEIIDLIKAIENEMKDFHCRLCGIEANRK